MPGMIGPSYNLFGGAYNNQQQNMFTPEQAYPASIKSAGEGYDEIMQGYRNILAQKPSNTNTNTINDIMQRYKNLGSSTDPANTYTPSADVTAAMGNLSSLAQTGGYSSGDVSNLRARAISPIRAVYANAMRGLDRQRSLTGGYSPGYGAASTKMAREQSEQIGGATTNVNAQLAQMIAQGKQQAAPQYASFAGEEANRALSQKNRISDLTLAGTRGMADTVGLQRQQELDDQNRQNEALRGMTSIYGTTPALANMFGNQAMSQVQTAMNHPNTGINYGGGGMSGGIFGSAYRPYRTI